MSRATRFLDACRRRPADRTPVWLMRQAGRYQASYQALRQRHTFMALCKTPELAAQVTVAAVDELGVDAAIIFSDILIPVEAMGAPLRFTDAGPVLDRPVRDAADVAALRVPDPQRDMPFVAEAVRQTCRELDGKVPLVGFVGAPLTLASYLVEGGNSKSYNNLRELLFGSPGVAHDLLGRLADTAAAHLVAQVEAGCQAVQVFDSWGALLGPADYREFGVPYLRRVLAPLDGRDVPRILFGTGTATVLSLWPETGAEVIGVDWRVDLREARRVVGPDVALQGNLDPGHLFLPLPELEKRVKAVLASAGPAPGHVFNLGHGVLPNTDENKVRELVKMVHRLTRRP